jgi:hypothetical protein
MSHKRQGQLTVSGAWAKHLRPYMKRAFWKSERHAERDVLEVDSSVSATGDALNSRRNSVPKQSGLK